VQHVGEDAGRIGGVIGRSGSLVLYGLRHSRPELTFIAPCIVTAVELAS
jgi:hypothetical protein